MAPYGVYEMCNKEHIHERGGELMFIDATLLFILMFVKFFVSFVLLVLRHIIVADGLIFGIFATALLSEKTALSTELCVVLGILVCLAVILISKWKVTFVPIAILGSLMWALMGMELFSQHMSEHIVVSVLLVLFNIGLHVVSREKILEFMDSA